LQFNCTEVLVSSSQSVPRALRWVQILLLCPLLVVINTYNVAHDVVANEPTGSHIFELACWSFVWVINIGLQVSSYARSDEQKPPPPSS
jgi:hypothetical protein